MGCSGSSGHASQASNREEAYVSKLLMLAEVVSDYERGRLGRQEALNKADSCMKSITAMGQIDENRARIMLEKRGFSEQRRNELRQVYFELQSGPQDSSFRDGSEASHRGMPSTRGLELEQMSNQGSQYSYRSGMSNQDSQYSYRSMPSTHGRGLQQRAPQDSSFRYSPREQQQAYHGPPSTYRPGLQQSAYDPNGSQLADRDGWKLHDEQRGIKAIEYRVRYESREVADDAPDHFMHFQGRREGESYQRARPQYAPAIRF